MWYKPGDGGKDCEILFGDNSKANYQRVALQLEHLSRVITVCLEHVHGGTAAKEIKDMTAGIATAISHIKELDRYLDNARKLVSNVEQYASTLPTKMKKFQYPTSDEVDYDIDALMPFACIQQHRTWATGSKDFRQIDGAGTFVVGHSLVFSAVTSLMNSS